jgi:hypothetical protein
MNGVAVNCGSLFPSQMAGTLAPVRYARTSARHVFPGETSAGVIVTAIWRSPRLPISPANLAPHHSVQDHESVIYGPFYQFEENYPATIVEWSRQVASFNNKGSTS